MEKRAKLTVIYAIRAREKFFIGTYSSRFLSNKRTRGVCIWSNGKRDLDGNKTGPSMSLGLRELT